MSSEAPTGRLTRSRTDRIIAGVAGGIAKYFQIDSTIVRIIFILLAFAGIGVVLYIILIFVMPNEEVVSSDPAETIKNNVKNLGKEMREQAQKMQGNWSVQSPQPHHSRIWLGIIILIVGVLLLLQNFAFLTFLSLGKLWPIILVAIGITILARRPNG